MHHAARGKIRVAIDPFLTIGGSLVVSIFGMLLTNAISSGWRSNKIAADLREVISNHVNGLHRKIDDTSDDLQMRIDGGLRVIDDKLDQHFRDDVTQFAGIRRETGEMGHALREKIRETELWNRDNFLQVKHFDEKIANLLHRMDQQDHVLSNIEQNGKH